MEAVQPAKPAQIHRSNRSWRRLPGRLSIPGMVGQPTSFRVSNVDAQRCEVIIDGQVSRDWVALDDGLEINTTVGNHTILVTIR